MCSYILLFPPIDFGGQDFNTYILAVHIDLKSNYATETAVACAKHLFLLCISAFNYVVKLFI